ncbi:MAG: sugar MFS transporter [Bacteroidetes bacterium]|jgi:MFS transporter, FHS family, L-fucose permease|nr:sugar MFS transporter [Bacteroidota bacterium]MBT6685801.1 sugar MFS transporter [Bacteroidota bacterium]MBT7143713.1 sugar MFS transporter [Bacteroidota bacterium]MBT7491940.1 sugar MFS transporter [Bacteroidota bacterium]
MTKSLNSKKENLIPISIIAVLFFIFGFVTWLNATLIPYLKIACELSDFEAYLVTTAFYISYFVMAIPSSWILEKTGYKRGMALGLFVMALGSLIFIPAAMTRIYELFLAGLFVQGLGLSILQTASNPYVTILGPIESAARRISIMGIANKVAGIISPIVLGAVVLKGTDKIVEDLKLMSIAEKNSQLQELAERAINPYIIMAISLVVLAILVKHSALPEIEESKDNESDNLGAFQKLKRAIRIPYLVFGFFAIFFYVGAEVISVDTLGLYGNSLGFGVEDSKFFASFTLFGMLIGYVFGIVAIPKFIKQETALKYFAILGIVFTIAAIFTDGYTSVLFIACLGFANSIMWPAIWPLAIEGLNKFTKIGSAILIMGIAGGAILTPLFGIVSEYSGNMQKSYSLLIICYLYILFYAVFGYRVGRKNLEKISS